MGYYKRLSTYRAEVKRYNASRRKATQLTNTPASGLIRLETVSETERFSMAQDADRLTAYNKAVEKWQDQCGPTITSRNSRPQYANSP